jgi:hypothetical protein
MALTDAALNTRRPHFRKTAWFTPVRKAAWSIKYSVLAVEILHIGKF